jgi:hypothetical protein
MPVKRPPEDDFSIESNSCKWVITFNGADKESTYEKTTIGMDGA